MGGRYMARPRRLPVGAAHGSWGKTPSVNCYADLTEGMPMTTEECFEAAVQVEHLMRDVYVGLAGHYTRDPARREMLRHLAEEEEQHAHRIRLLARTQDTAAWAQETADRIAQNLEAMSTELLAIVQEMGDDFEGAPPDRLLLRVMNAEDHCSAIHAEVLAESAEIDVQLLFAALAKQDVRHKEILQKALAS
jgi:rubrerythrin